MKRRTFLRTAGGLTGTAAAAWSSVPLSAAESTTEPSELARRILWVGPHSKLTAALERALPAEIEFSQARLGAIGPDTAPRTVAGTGGVVVASPVPSDSLAAEIEQATRPVYDLLRAAADRDVRRVVYLSTLAVMHPYFTASGPEYVVDEKWAPQPHDAASGLPAYLGEVVCREFARAGKLEVVVLRLGQLEGHAPTTNGWALPQADPRDTAQAIVAALTGNRPHWNVFHVHSADVPTLPANTAIAAREHRQVDSAEDV